MKKLALSHLDELETMLEKAGTLGELMVVTGRAAIIINIWGNVLSHMKVDIADTPEPEVELRVIEDIEGMVTEINKWLEALRARPFKHEAPPAKEAKEAKKK